MTRIHLLLVTLATLVVAAIAPSVAAAAPAVNGEFPLSGSPGQLTQGPDGNVWVVLKNGKDVARVAPDGTVTEYDAANITNPVGIAAGPDGNLWVTQSGGVARFAPANPVGAEKFAIAELLDARGITAGPDGNLWAASGDNALRIPPANPTGYTKFNVAGMGARGITKGGDGKLHIADFGSQRIVHLTTAGAATFTSVGGGPQEVAAGPGTQLAYANPGANPHHIGRINAEGTFLPSDVPATDPFGIAYAADEAYWVAQFASSGVARVTPDGDVTNIAGVPAGSGPRYITAGLGNTVWVSLETANKVLRITGVEKPQTTGNGGGGGGTNGGGARPDVTPPAFGALSVKPRAGGAVTIRLSSFEAGAVSLRFERAVKDKRGRTRWVKVTRLARPLAAGPNAIRWDGKVKGRPLAAGRYRVTVVAKDAAGNASAGKTVAFSVKRRAK